MRCQARAPLCAATLDMIDPIVGIKIVQNDRNGRGE
jgi:hypothetical protein